MTKIDIISGFLGAGKTTFIKKLLQEAIKGEQVVLIENEFGQIGIDGGFLKDSGIEIREMNSGCICCSLVGDFGKSLEEVLTKYKPERVIIEPSGVGKLSDVMNAVRDVHQVAGHMVVLHIAHAYAQHLGGICFIELLLGDAVMLTTTFYQLSFGHCTRRINTDLSYQIDGFDSSFVASIT